MTMIDRALTAETTDAVAEIAVATVSAAGVQATQLLGGPSAPDANGTDSDATEYNVAWQLLTFRLLLASTPDVLPAVVGLRRWGVTWDLIAQSAGIARQSAHERWSAPVRGVLNRYGTGQLGGPVADDDS